MIWIDYALIAVLIISAIVGAYRGFFREALSLGIWVIALWCAWQFDFVAAARLEPWIEDPVLRLWAARLAILVAILFSGAIVSIAITALLDRSGLTGTDRSLGVLFGLGRGGIIAGLVVIALQFGGFNEAPWWEESKLLPYASPIADKLRAAAAEGIDKLNENEPQP